MDPMIYNRSIRDECSDVGSVILSHMGCQARGESWTKGSTNISLTKSADFSRISKCILLDITQLRYDPN